MVLRRGNEKFKTFSCLKTKFKANTTTQGNVYIIDLFKNFTEFENMWEGGGGGLKTPLNPPGATVLVCKIQNKKIMEWTKTHFIVVMVTM